MRRQVAAVANGEPGTAAGAAPVEGEAAMLWPLRLGKARGQPAQRRGTLHMSLTPQMCLTSDVPHLRCPSPRGLHRRLLCSCNLLPVVRSGATHTAAHASAWQARSADSSLCRVHARRMEHRGPEARSPQHAGSG